MAHFDIQRVSLGGPIFDVEKLSWLNGMWIREDLDEATAGAAAGGLGLQPGQPDEGAAPCPEAHGDAE